MNDMKKLIHRLAIVGLVGMVVIMVALTACPSDSDDDPSPSPTGTLRRTDATASESDTSDVGMFELELREAPAGSTVTIVYELTGTAILDDDFTVNSEFTEGRFVSNNTATSTLVISVSSSGSASGTVTIVPEVDVVDEDDETVILRIVSATFANGSTATLEQPTEAALRTVTITNDADLPTGTLRRTDATASEGDTSDVGVFEFEIMNAPEGTVTVIYELTGTATPRDDFTVSYTPLEGRLVLEGRLDSRTIETNIFVVSVGSSGSASGTVTIVPEVDVVDEDDETVILRIVSATFADGNRATLEQPTEDALRTVTITNDADLPTGTLRRTDATASEGDTSDVGVFELEITNAPEGTVTVVYELTGTATPGDDFTVDYAVTEGGLVSRSIETSTFVVSVGSSGSANGRLTIVPVVDVVNEDDETVIVSILSATFANGSTATLEQPTEDALRTVTIISTNSI